MHVKIHSPLLAGRVHSRESIKNDPLSRGLIPTVEHDTQAPSITESGASAVHAIGGEQPLLSKETRLV